MCKLLKYPHQAQSSVHFSLLFFLCFQDLKEECVKLRTRVFDLEQQNRILSVLFQQRVKMSTSPVSQVRTTWRNGHKQKLTDLPCFKAV